jgi:hypothetical protein
VLTWAAEAFESAHEAATQESKKDVFADPSHSSSNAAQMLAVRRVIQPVGRRKAEANCSNEPLWVIASQCGREPCNGAKQYADTY